MDAILAPELTKLSLLFGEALMGLAIPQPFKAAADALANFDSWLESQF